MDGWMDGWVGGGMDGLANYLLSGGSSSQKKWAPS